MNSLRILWHEVTVHSDYMVETYANVSAADFIDICREYGLDGGKLMDATQVGRLNGAHTLVLDLKKIPEEMRLKKAIDYEAELKRVRAEFVKVRADSFAIAEKIQKLLGEI